MLKIKDMPFLRSHTTATTASTNTCHPNHITYLGVQIDVGPGPTESSRHTTQGDETTEKGTAPGGNVQEQTDGPPWGNAFR